MPRVPALLALLVLVALSGCGATGQQGGGGATVAPSTGVAAFAPSTTVPAPAPVPGPDDGTVGTQPARLDDQRIDTSSAPARLAIEDLGIDASVVPVGVEPDGDMQVPPATEVGWYRFGPTPGSDGSAVLAAHVDYDGARGVFFDLRSIQPGAVVVVTGGDGTSARFVVESVAQLAKDDLAVTDVFDRAGAPRLTLITCGGDFDDSARSYRDNIVVTTVPAG